MAEKVSVSLKMHNAGAAALPNPPSVYLDECGAIKIKYHAPDPTLIYRMMVAAKEESNG